MAADSTYSAYSASMTDVKQTIANILAIENSDSWEITSSIPEKNLYLIHYTQDADMKKFGDLRGVVVDIEARTVVCRSFGFTPTAEVDKLEIAPDGKYRIADIYGIQHVIDPQSLRIKLGFEGTIMRVFKHDGVVYHSTHRRLDASRSRWGDSISFLEMYHQLKGPSDDDLFSPNSKYSPYCYIFLMVHPQVLVTTKQDVGTGYMVDLGPKQMWSLDPATCPYKQTEADGTPVTSNFDDDVRPNAGWIDPRLRMPYSVDHLPAVIKTPVLLNPTNLTLEEANRHLTNGFYESLGSETPENLDPRLWPGEFVMLYKLNEQKQITGLLKVQGISYSWRSTIRGNDANLYHRFFYLLNKSYIDTLRPEGRDAYLKSFPLLTRYSVEAIQETLASKGSFVVWPQLAGDVSINTKDDRLHNIWEAYLMSVPLNRQIDVSNMYPQFIRDRANVVEWIRQLDDEETELNNPDVPRRARQIIAEARKYAQQRQATGQNLSRNGKRMGVRLMTKDNIRNLISKEEGSSLYRLVRDMKIAQMAAPQESESI